MVDASRRRSDERLMPALAQGSHLSITQVDEIFVNLGDEMKIKNAIIY